MCNIFKACADKLKREMTDYGCPPVFPETEETTPDEQIEDEAVIKDKSRSKKVRGTNHPLGLLFL